jgi:hypothetical protein
VSGGNNQTRRGGYYMILILSLIPLILGAMIAIVALVKKTRSKMAAVIITDMKNDKNKEVRLNVQSNRN